MVLEKIKLNKKKSILGCRIFVPFDEHKDLGFVIPIGDKKYSFDVMVHPCSDDPSGIILWFNMEELKK